MAILARLLPLLLPLALAEAAPPKPNRLFPMASYQELGRPWLESQQDERLFSAPFQARIGAAGIRYARPGTGPVALGA